MKRRFAIGLALTVLSAGCQREMAIEPKVYKGSLVPAGQLKPVFGLTYNNQRAPRCGAALIAPDMLLTAAHCICGAAPSNAVLGNDPTGADGWFYKLGRGRAALDCRSQTSRTRIDLAVIPIIGRSDRAVPLVLASDAEIAAASSFVVAGYGATDAGGSVTDFRKRRADVPLASAACTGAGEAERYGCQAGQEIVAGRREGADTCSGDSGTPLLVRVAVSAAAPDGLRIGGVTSRGVKAQVNCGAGGIYERIATQRNWIARTVTDLRQVRLDNRQTGDSGQADPAR